MAASSHAGARGARGFRTSIPPVGAADPIRTAPSPREDMIDALDDDASAQHFAEDCQFRAAERLAGRRRRTDRTMVLNQQERAVGPLGIARHITLAAADVGKSRKLPSQRAPL